MTFKKWMIAASAAAVVLLSGTSIMALAKANPIKIMLNGTELVTAKAAQKVDGIVMLPLKELGQLFGKKVSYDEKSNTVSVDKISGVTIGESEDKTVHITGNKTETGTFDQLQIQTSVFSRSIPGYNVTNPSYAPFIITQDLDGDGQKEIVIILTTGYGTGVYQSNVLVYTAEGDLIPVEDANTAFLKQFSGSYTAKGLEITLQANHYTIPSELMMTEKEYLGDKPGIGGIMRYTVEDGVLTATTAVQVSPSEFVGDINLKYSFKNGLFQAENATFELYPEYRS
ncbi:stalk domain-containing protein [Paenibacillus dokdonensis]|uniref:stalk domain-containing protein n=1 Tax=Paenibacillus dokdonensis TaxID=2567944 RepID=UPI0010A93352|nr:stalk domain-containing protein [Paenibacillus dokdonensis]